MSKRTFDAAVEDLLKIREHDVSGGDILQATVAEKLARRIRELEEHYLRFREQYKKRSGRHAKVSGRDEDRAVKLYCYLEIEDMILNGEAKTVTDAAVKIGEEGVYMDDEQRRHLDADTIRNYYYRQRKKHAPDVKPAAKKRVRRSPRTT